MNLDQISGIVRAIVPAVLAYLVGKGYISETAVGDITAAAVAIAAAVWSVATNSTSHKLTTAVSEPDAVAAAKTIIPSPQVRAVADAMKEVPKK